MAKTQKRKPGRPRKKAQGLGDTIEQITEATGIKKVVEFVAGEDCGCDGRKKKLNEMFPYRLKPKCLTEEQYNWYKEFSENRSLSITEEQRKGIAKMYSEVFSRPYYEPCASCASGPKQYLSMITQLDKVFETYENE